ncbi:MAG: NAD(P)-dependent oxidoreductase [Rubrobacteraceae bacterium]
MSKLRVLLTGATGYVAGQLLPEFRDRYDLRLIDIREEDSAGQPVEGVEVVDLLNDENSVLEPFFAEADIVVHTAYKFGAQDLPASETDPQSMYDLERLNVDMTQRVYQLAYDNDVKRVVVASTNQAAKWYEQPYYAGLRDRVSPEDYPRPDNFYGWAKAAYESLGFLYACGSLGKKLEVIQIRIVVPREIAPGDFEGRPERLVRDLAGYVSERDLQQLFRKSIETSDVNDEHGVPFHIFYGVSNNARTFWSITNALRVIGYQPQDDSEVRFAEGIAKLLK